MKKQVYFDKLIKNTFNAKTSGISLSAGTFENIQERIANESKGNRNPKGHSVLFIKPAAIAACIALALAFTMLLSPQARAHASSLAQTLGLKLFKLTDEELDKLKKNSIDVDIDKMQEGQTINGLSIQKAEQKQDQVPNAVLSEQSEEGVMIEKSVDSFQVTDQLMESIKKNSDAINADGAAEGANSTSDEIKIEKTN